MTSGAALQKLRVQNTNREMSEVWPVALAFLQREALWVAQFMRSPPQTNEKLRKMLAARAPWE